MDEHKFTCSPTWDKPLNEHQMYIVVLAQEKPPLWLNPKEWFWLHVGNSWVLWCFLQCCAAGASASWVPFRRAVWLGQALLPAGGWRRPPEVPCSLGFFLWFNDTFHLLHSTDYRRGL